MARRVFVLAHVVTAAGGAVDVTEQTEEFDTVDVYLSSTGAISGTLTVSAVHPNNGQSIVVTGIGLTAGAAPTIISFPSSGKGGTGWMANSNGTPAVPFSVRVQVVGAAGAVVTVVIVASRKDP